MASEDVGPRSLPPGDEHGDVEHGDVARLAAAENLQTIGCDPERLPAPMRKLLAELEARLLDPTLDDSMTVIRRDAGIGDGSASSYEATSSPPRRSSTCS